MQTAYTITLVLSTADIIPNKRHDSFKLLNLHPAVYILMQISAILNTCCREGKILGER
jgi:hypothetical protein